MLPNTIVFQIVENSSVIDMKSHDDGEANWKSLFSSKNGETTQVITKKRFHKKNERFTIAYLQVSLI